MDRKEKLLVACTAVVVVTLGVCTAVVRWEIRNQDPASDYTSEIQKIEGLDESIAAQLQCVNYRLMNVSEKITYSQIHPGDTC
jgi:hypothetical protein